MFETPLTGTLVPLCRPIQPQSAAASSAPSVSPGSSPSTTTTTAAAAAKHKDPNAPSGGLLSPTGSRLTSSAGGGGGMVGFPGPNCKCLIALNIAPFLDEQSLISLMRSCKRMREITASDDVWEVRLKDMRVNVILINRTSNFFRAFRSEIVTLRGLEGFYDFEAEEAEPSSSNNVSTSATTAVRKVLLTIAPAFLGFVTPVARVVLVIQYWGMQQQDVFEGTMRYSFPKRLFVMSTYLTRCPRQEGPRFDVVVARSVRKWGTQKPSHFETVRGGTRLIISIAQAAQSPANGFLPSNELLTVSRLPRDGEGAAAPLPGSASPGGGGGGGTASTSSLAGSENSSKAVATAAAAAANATSPPTSERRFSLRSFLGRGK